MPFLFLTWSWPAAASDPHPFLHILNLRTLLRPMADAPRLFSWTEISPLTTWLCNYLLTKRLWLSFRRLKLSMATWNSWPSLNLFILHVPRLHEWPSWRLALLSCPCPSPSPAKPTPRHSTHETPSPRPAHLLPFLGPCCLSLDYDNCFLINFQCTSHTLMAGATSSLFGSARSLS